MKNKKIRASSQVRTNLDSDNFPANFQASLIKKQTVNSIPELNPTLTALHAAHKGMHPVLFTILAALHEVLHNQGTVAGLGK